MVMAVHTVCVVALAHSVISTVLPQLCLQSPQIQLALPPAISAVPAPESRVQEPVVTCPSHHYLLSIHFPMRTLTPCGQEPHLSCPPKQALTSSINLTFKRLPKTLAGENVNHSFQYCRWETNSQRRSTWCRDLERKNNMNQTFKYIPELMNIPQVFTLSHIWMFSEVIYLATNFPKSTL